MALELFEFQDQLMADTFLIEVTQFEKIGSQCKFFLFRREILKLKPILETRSRQEVS